MVGRPQGRAEALGYAPDAKLLIVHADDLGMSHSVNLASIKAFETGLVNSGSIMVPCPWFPEIASYANSHPEFDLGVHLTLTSEWTFYRWGPVAPKGDAPTLYDKQGYFPADSDEIIWNAAIDEIETEIRNQIERAYEFGIRPTHLDSHMNALYGNLALLELVIRVAGEYKLPVKLSREWFPEDIYLPASLGSEYLLIDRIVYALPGIPAERWRLYYTDIIKSLQPGITEVIVHLAYDDEEMRAVAAEHTDWGAAWRQRDFDFFTSEEFKQLLEENEIKLITFRELGKLMERRQLV